MMTDFYYEGTTAKLCSQIETLEALREEKKRMRKAVSQSSNRMKRQLGYTLLPQNSTLLHSPLRIVRYSAYAITAYKMFRFINQMAKYFSKLRR